MIEVYVTAINLSKMTNADGCNCLIFLFTMLRFCDEYDKKL